MITPPLPEEIEVAVIGPGFGEAVLVHIGDGKWIVIDSCQHPDRNRSAALEYLEGMGFNPSTAVICVVVTHFDQDHIKGLSGLVEAASGAKYVAALPMLDRDFIKFAEVVAGDPTRVGSTATHEITKVFSVLANQARATTYAAPGRRIFEVGSIALGHGQNFELTTLSPGDAESQSFLDWLATHMPVPGVEKGDPPARIRNDLSIVLLITVGGVNILLGGDLEEEGRPDTGWTAVLAQRTAGAWPKGELFKVPHHGSQTGHHADVWSDMLGGSPVSILAPWFNGGSALPEASDRQRIIGLSGSAFSTATSRAKKSRKRIPAVERTIRETVGELISNESIPGIVRARRSAVVAGDSWRIDLFEGACSLQDWPA